MFSHVALRIGQLWNAPNGVDNSVNNSQSVLLGLYDGVTTEWEWLNTYGDIPTNDPRPTAPVKAHSVMNTISVPLSSFSRINKDNIEAFILAFPKGTKGTLMIDSLEWFRGE